jgi:hypothetical protein
MSATGSLPVVQLPQGLHCGRAATEISPSGPLIALTVIRLVRLPIG